MLHTLMLHGSAGSSATHMPTLCRCPLQYGRQQLNINGLANMAATGRSTMGIVNPGLAQVRGGHSRRGDGAQPLWSL